jgi:hypothetical protein
MAGEVERLKILEMIEKGQITAQDGVRLLEALTGDEEQAALPENLPPADLPADSVSVPYPAQESFLQESPPEIARFSAPESSPGDASDQSDAEDEPHFQAQPEVISPQERFNPSALKWRSFWWIPMLVGVSITLVAAVLMYSAWNASGFGFWFACTWFPFLLGVTVMALAWASRTARWLHVRVEQKEGESPQRIAISLPIPLRLTAWFLRTFGHKIPHLGNTGLDELIVALDATSPETPFYVEVNEGANGEHVEVYIG